MFKRLFSLIMTDSEVEAEVAARKPVDVLAKKRRKAQRYLKSRGITQPKALYPSPLQS